MRFKNAIAIVHKIIWSTGDGFVGVGTHCIVNTIIYLQCVVLYTWRVCDVGILLSTSNV